eukprot:CAMPEP_0185783364 /NCGR_PEP_ID=MMETSP1174-20130828/116337_1 /TAXON_ID=35687 /ORGANISM="Dictyocha speculum, Strain CCMP1381" /LENGTH=48 /DNA_ID= /DNA_START= /DNA_END= /DNA_ORIENTATION=
MNGPGGLPPAAADLLNRSGINSLQLPSYANPPPSHPALPQQQQQQQQQ